jgi:hypothetical protein
MSEVIIPIKKTPYQEVEAPLSGVQYIFVIKYNSRIDNYTLSVLLSDRTPLAEGINIVKGYSLLSRFVNESLPPGKLVAIDQRGTGAEGSYNELGTSLLLAYRGL